VPVEFELAYGRTAVRLALPEGDILQVLRVDDVPSLGDARVSLAGHIREALRNPIGCAPLGRIVRPGERVVIVVNDQTRLARSELFLPPLLDELNSAGVPDANVTCLFALGAHRPLRPEEMRSLVGDETARRVALVNHDCDDPAGLVTVGRTSRGTEVRVNRLLTESDRIVLTGSIVYHFFAGFGGGRKAAVPGCAGRSTIQQNHSMMLGPGATAGRLKGNPVHEDLLEAARLLKPGFILNVVLNGRGEIAGVFAGDMEAAHLAGCRFCDRLYGVTVERPADLVIASCGGWPKDINVYQAQKTMDNAARAVREGGVLVLIAECPEGAGNQMYIEWMRRYGTPAAIAAAVRERFELGGHKAYAVTRLLAKAEVVLVSAMPEEDVRALLLTPAGSLEQALCIARSRLGPHPTTIVMPNGGLTVPRLAPFRDRRPVPG